MSKYTLSIGIVGLPNVGKSTLFNALLKRQQALAANYPFATIEPNVGIVEVPDVRLQELAQVVKNEFDRSQQGGIPKKVTAATITFHDIAGLVEGASRGEGLGNKFLANIRETDAIAHVVRAFDDSNVIREGSVSPEDDIKVINTELILADLDTLSKRIEKHSQNLKKDKSKENLELGNIYQELNNVLNNGLFASTIESEKISKVKDLNLLTFKPAIYIFNVSEDEISSERTKSLLNSLSNSIAVSARIESELSTLSTEDQRAYMDDLKIEQSGLDQVIKTGYKTLGLQTFFTAGPKEVRAWTIQKGTKAPQAAGKIHTDFEKGFIKADVVSFSDLIKAGSYKSARDLGLMRLEGKDYNMQDGDVVEFRFNN